MEEEQDQCRQVEISRAPGRRSGCSVPPRRAGAAPRRRRRPGCHAAATADVHARSSAGRPSTSTTSRTPTTSVEPGKADPPELRNEATLVLQLAASGELLHRCFSRHQPRELHLVPQHDSRRACRARRGRAGAHLLRRCPSKHDGRRESKDGNCDAHAHGQTYHGQKRLRRVLPLMGLASVMGPEQGKISGFGFRSHAALYG